MENSEIFNKDKDFRTREGASLFVSYVENVRKFQLWREKEISNNFIIKVTLNSFKIFKILVNGENF
jgi:hypothetical protein